MDASLTLSDDLGEIKMHHTYNGAVPVGRGWMICNGDVINSTNYDAIHGAGSYSRDNVASSPIVGKHLPNMVNKFAVGSASTTQTGSSAITSEGNSGHTINLSHVHKWYKSNANGNHDQSHNSGGTLTNLTTAEAKSNSIVGIYADFAADRRVLTPDYYTSNDGSSSQSIKPESIQVIYKMKVI